MGSSVTTAEPCPGLIGAWRFAPGNIVEHLDDAAVATAIAAGADGLWLHLDLLDQRTRGVIARLPLPPTARAALVEPDEAAHLELADGALFGAVPDFTFEAPESGHADEMVLLHLALTPRLLVTARRHPLRVVHAVAQRPVCGTPVEAFATILLRVADEVERLLRRRADELVHVEEALLREKVEGRRSTLAALRRHALQLERRFAPAVTALTALAEDEEDGAAAEFLRPVLRAARRYAAALQSIAALKERARIAQDEMANLAAEQTNRRLFVLSVISAAMLPASLVAGVFGMNVGELPGVDKDWGFAMAMALIIASIVGILGALRFWRLL